MSLQDRLDEIKAQTKTLYPADIVDAWNRGADELVASGRAADVLKAGDKAPAFTLPDSDGTEVSSAALLAEGPLVITFYRGVWCPYCNADLQAFEAEYGNIRGLGASLVAISAQTAANNRKARRQNNLTFPILTDKGNVLAESFGLRFELPDYLRASYRRQEVGVDLAQFNGEPSWTLPMPARFIVVPDGTIVYAEVSPDHTRRPDPGELLPTLERLSAEARDL